MCGICGIVSSSGLADPEVSRRWVEEMLQSLSHRGPDAVGEVETESAVLGATRLTIRGLEESSQPMVDPETGIVAVCNGEIDNHRELRRWLAERSRPVLQQTDVAVIPGLFREFGERFASKLVGAFAVAVWDPRSRRLTLARDRAGERPLFFTCNGGEIIFANELAAIVSRSRLLVNLDQKALLKYLQFGIFPSPDTPFAEIRKVAPGELVQFDAGRPRRTRYWRWQNAEAATQPPSLDAFDEVFRGAVGRQCDADVDFGVFLSGGIDSSLVSAVARALHPTRRLKAFTLRFEEESFDEGGFAQSVARQLKMDLVTVWVRPEDLVRELKGLLHLVGEPLADPAWLPVALLARRAAQDIRLGLVGEGADELFGGYPTYLGAELARQFTRLPRWAKSVFQRAVEALPSSDKKVTVSFLLKRFVQGIDLDGVARHRLWVSNIAPALLQRLGVAPLDLDDDDDDGAANLLLDRVQRWDLETSLAEGLLTKTDRASMSYALELRAPFLDQAVMEFAASLPVADRVRGFDTKVFLKRYALRYLPSQIVHRRKRGLSVPIGRWLRGPLHDWASDILGSGRLDRVGIRKSAAINLLSEHCQLKADHARALWTLLVLSEWLDWLENLTGSLPGGALSAGCDTRKAAPVS
jgi:asparagine synthase (glutamine-hydrolysing)